METACFDLLITWFDLFLHVHTHVKMYSFTSIGREEGKPVKIHLLVFCHASITINFGPFSFRTNLFGVRNF